MSKTMEMIDIVIIMLEKRLQISTATILLISKIFSKTAYAGSKICPTSLRPPQITPLVSTASVSRAKIIFCLL